MSTHVPQLEVSTGPSPSSDTIPSFGYPSIDRLDFDEWLAATWCSRETIRRLSGV